MLKCPNCDSKEFFVFVAYRVTLDENEEIIDQGKIDCLGSNMTECIECGHSMDLDRFRAEGDKNDIPAESTKV